MQTQKVIKYIAMIFAIYLAISIIAAVIFGMANIANIFSSDDGILENMEKTSVVEKNITKIEIDIAASNLIIKEGEELAVETNNSYIQTKETNNKLTVSEKKHSSWNKGESQLILYLPSALELEEIDIETGAGKITADTLKGQIIKLDLGAGEVTIDNIIASQKIEIDGGAGKIEIKDGSLNNLDLDMDVGKVTINANITGNSEIDAGVGELNINVLAPKEEYTWKVEKGIGTIKIDNETISTKGRYGTGTNRLEIEGGVGNINITFAS